MSLSPTSSRGSSSGASSQTLLSTTTLAAPGQFDVSAIDQTYNDLVLVLICRCSIAATQDLLDLRLNNDSGANQYEISVAPMNSGAVTASRSQVTLARISQNCPASTALAGLFGMYKIEIYGYTSTTFIKQGIVNGITTISGTQVTLGSEQTSLFWNSTAAVNRVTIFGDSAANLAIGSMLRIYGRL
jgi:hypothetical protein